MTTTTTKTSTTTRMRTMWDPRESRDESRGQFSLEFLPSNVSSTIGENKLNSGAGEKKSDQTPLKTVCLSVYPVVLFILTLYKVVSSACVPFLWLLVSASPFVRLSIPMAVLSISSAFSFRLLLTSPFIRQLCRFTAVSPTCHCSFLSSVSYVACSSLHQSAACPFFLQPVTAPSSH